MHDITWIGSNLGMTDDKGGLEATQIGEYTVINVGDEERNPKADIIASLPWFNIDPKLLDKLSTVIEEISICFILKILRCSFRIQRASHIVFT